MSTSHALPCPNMPSHPTFPQVLRLAVTLSPDGDAAAAAAAARACERLDAYERAARMQAAAKYHECRALLCSAAADAWTRLLKPSLAREVQRRALESARRQAAKRFPDT